MLHKLLNVWLVLQLTPVLVMTFVINPKEYKINK